MPIDPTLNPTKQLRRPIEANMRTFFQRVQFDEGLHIGLATPRDHLLNPLHTGSERLIADHDVNPFSPRRNIAQHSHFHHALTIQSLRLPTLPKPPRATINRPPT